jgi:alginate O-acetyltransferase complex protein AlgI
MLIVIVGWVLFRADSLAQAGDLLARMALLAPPSTLAVSELMTRGEALALVVALLFSTPTLPRLARRWLSGASERQLPVRVAPSAYVFGALASALVFGAVTTKVLTGAYSPFIYFRF